MTGRSLLTLLTTGLVGVVNHLSGVSQQVHQCYFVDFRPGSCDAPKGLCLGAGGLLPRFVMIYHDLSILIIIFPGIVI